MDIQTCLNGQSGIELARDEDEDELREWIDDRGKSNRENNSAYG
jgi:hypothetical protein